LTPPTGTPLPDFAQPPLSEVAISVQFEPLPRLVVPEIGLLWQHYGGKYPHVQQHPPVDPAIERLGVRRPRSRRPNIELVVETPFPRIWFLTDDEKELLQIQQDRFIRNWRKLSASDAYPRYDDHIRRAFVADLRDFQDFLDTNGIGRLTPNQCEITYVNYIEPANGFQTHAHIGKVFSIWQQDFADDSRYEVENATFSVRYLIRSDSGDFVGRVHASVQPVYRGTDDQTAFQLNLVARGKPFSPDLDGIMQFVDEGRERIVRLFADITRPEMHRTWGRKNQ